MFEDLFDDFSNKDDVNGSDAQLVNYDKDIDERPTRGGEVGEKRIGK